MNSVGLHNFYYGGTSRTSSNRLCRPERRRRRASASATWSSARESPHVSVGLLRADERVFDAMLDGWRAQLLARGLSTDYIKASCRTVTRFQERTNDYPSTSTTTSPIAGLIRRRQRCRRCAPRPVRSAPSATT